MVGVKWVFQHHVYTFKLQICIYEKKRVYCSFEKCYHINLLKILSKVVTVQVIKNIELFAAFVQRYVEVQLFIAFYRVDFDSIL